MADVADAQDVTDDAVAVAVDLSTLGLQIIHDHLALQNSTLNGVEADIVGVLIPGESVHIQLAGLAVGRLTVEPDDRFLCVGNAGREGRAAQREHQHQCQDNCKDFLHGIFLHF